MKKAKEIMMTPVVTVPMSTPLSELEEFFASEEISGVPVRSSSGNIVGIVSKTDLVQAERLHKSEKFSEIFAREQTAGDIMHHGVFFVSPDTNVRQVADIMIDQQIHRVLVGDNSNIVGIISSHDLLDLIH